jgi:hypothetical protein
LLGVLFALLPDIDFIVHYFSRRVSIFGHRGVTHTPFVYILITAALYLFGIDTNIVAMFFIATMFHLVHDVFVIGRGIMIIYPFSVKRLKLFPDNGGAGYLPQRYLWWDESRTPLYMFNTLHNDNWIKDWYLRWNVFVVVETGFAILFFASVYFIK